MGPCAGRLRRADALGLNSLALEVLELVFDVFPVVRVSQCALGFCDRWPFTRQFNIQFNELLLVGGDVFFRKNRVDGALGYADRAVDTLVRLNGEKVRAFPEAVHRTDIDTIRVAAADAGFGYNVGHEARPIGLSSASRKALYFKANKPSPQTELRCFPNMLILSAEYIGRCLGAYLVGILAPFS